MNLLSWLQSFVRSQRSHSSRPRAPRRLRIYRLEQLEERALPNDFYLSLVHVVDTSAGLHVLTSQPETQASVAVDRQRDAAALPEPFSFSTLLFDDSLARASKQTISDSFVRKA